MGETDFLLELNKLKKIYKSYSERNVQRAKIRVGAGLAQFPVEWDRKDEKEAAV